MTNHKHMVTQLTSAGGKPFMLYLDPGCLTMEACSKYHTEEDCDASTIYTEEEGEESTYAWSTAGSCATAPEEGELAALDVPVIF